MANRSIHQPQMRQGQAPAGKVDVLLVRHGQTIWNKLRKCQGFSDVELNDYGIGQAESLAKSLAHEPLDAIYASTLRRSRRTAEIIAEPHGLEVGQHDDFKELNHGILEGLTPEEIRQRHGEFLDRWLRQPGSEAIPNGESLEEVQARAWELLHHLVQELAGNAADRTIVVVGHYLTNLTLLCKVLGMPLSQYRRLAQETAAVNVLRFQADHVQVVRLNDTSHLHHYPVENSTAT